MIRTPSQLLESVEQSSIRHAVVACKLRIIDEDILIILDAQLRANLGIDLPPVQLRLHVRPPRPECQSLGPETHGLDDTNPGEVAKLVRGARGLDLASPAGGPCGRITRGK
jgi:hypothetical protein